jgi:hypothetical protein
MEYLLAERVFILVHNFASDSIAAVHEAFTSAYPKKKVPNKTTHRLLTNIRYAVNAHPLQVFVERQNSWNYGVAEL